MANVAGGLTLSDLDLMNGGIQMNERVRLVRPPIGASEPMQRRLDCGSTKAMCSPSFMGTAW